MPRLFTLAACAVLLTLIASGCATSSKKAFAVIVPVADVRAQPGTAPASDAHDPLQETQVLYGEGVRVLKRVDGWAQIEAVEQPEHSHHDKWEGYPGWVPETALSPSPKVWPRNVVVTAKWAPLWTDGFRTTRHALELPLGTLVRAADLGGVWRVELLDGAFAWMARADGRPLRELRALPPAQQRRMVVDAASLLLGDRYVWGGRSPQLDGAGTVTGVDCSGLVNLAHRAAGIAIPRDAHEQYLRAKPVASLQPGDLIFLSDADAPERIVHVLLYAGDGMLLEGPGTGLTVRRIPVAERLGRGIEQIQPGSAAPSGQVIRFGSYFAS